MSDYISREAAIEAMYKDAEAHPDHTFWTSQHEALMDIPAADVRPVLRGKWIQTTQPMGWRDEECAECSVCGEDFVLDECAMDEFTNLMNFCPNCGADMRGESDV